MNFPLHLKQYKNWLQPIEHPYFVVHLLHESGLCARFPEQALGLLDAIIANQPWPPEELSQCLEAIASTSPPLHNDRRYNRIAEYLRIHGS